MLVSAWEVLEDERGLQDQLLDVAWSFVGNAMMQSAAFRSREGTAFPTAGLLCRQKASGHAKGRFAAVAIRECVSGTESEADLRSVEMTSGSAKTLAGPCDEAIKVCVSRRHRRYRLWTSVSKASESKVQPQCSLLGGRVRARICADSDGLAEREVAP